MIDKSSTTTLAVCPDADCSFCLLSTDETVARLGLHDHLYTHGFVAFGRQREVQRRWLHRHGVSIVGRSLA